MSSSVDSSVVLLKVQTDWPRWLAVIKTKASYNKVWDYIKFTLDNGEVQQELHKSIPLIIKDYLVIPDTILAPTTKTLTVEELNRFKIDYKIYKDKLKK